MRKMNWLAGGAAAAALLAALPASAATTTFRADLSPLNDTSVTGFASFVYDDVAQTLMVTVNASGLEPGTVHPQHIHGSFAQQGCDITAPADSPIAGLCLDGNMTADSTIPTVAENDIDGDGFLETVEGAPAYGPIILALGNADAGLDGLPGSFPMSDADGNVNFTETYDLGSTSLLFDTLNEIGHDASDLFPLTDRVFVIHGVDVNNNMAAVDGDLFEIQGPTDEYIALLPAAAGEIQLVEEVPAPAALGLLGLGLAGLYGARRRKNA